MYIYSVTKKVERQLDIGDQKGVANETNPSPGGKVARERAREKRP
jgi:hypothetical protein